MMRTSNTRPAVFAFLVSIVYWWSEQQLVLAAQVNITVDDTDSGLVYQPSGSWHASSIPCSFCLSPDTSIAYQSTYHDGTHIIPTSDKDDDPSTPSQTSSNPPQSPSTSSHISSTFSAPAPTQSAHDDDDDDDDDDDNSNKKGGGKGKSTDSRRDINPFETNKLDSDDPGFVDNPVTLIFNFTGSAIYLFCIQPLGVAAVNTTPTNMNLTFNIDGQSYGGFSSSGTSTSSGFLPGVNVFTQTDLTEAPHALQVNVGVDSVFLFDYLIYTQQNDDSPTLTITSPGSQLTSSPSSPSPSPVTHATTKSGKATFGGAVGGSFGVLSICAFAIAANLYRRRRLAARRDRLERSRDHESLHTNGSEDTPPMQGPAPFVPRFFPGTVPAAPPPYAARLESDSESSSSGNTSFVSSNASPVPYTPLHLLTAPRPLTYADVPPSTPPPPLDDDNDHIIIPPPPPFGVAIATPVPAILASVLSPPAHRSAAIDFSSTQQSVGSVSTSPPSDTRSPSQISLLVPLPPSPRPSSPARSHSPPVELLAERSHAHISRDTSDENGSSSSV